MISKIRCQRAVLIAVICFAVVSCLNCCNIVGVYMIDVDLFRAGESFVKESKANSVGLILPLCVAQLGLQCIRKPWARIWSAVAALIACLVTIICTPLHNVHFYLMGGLIGYHPEMTLLWYIAVTLSVLILFLRIILLKDRAEMSVGK